MIFISLILDGVFSRFFYPLFTLISLIFIYKKENRYLITLISGFIYDLVYTDTLFLNTLIFMLILLLIEFIFKCIRFNLVNVILVSILVIIIYRTSIYFILCIINYIEFNIIDLFYGIIYSLINVIFTIIIYLTNKKFNI